MKMRWLIVLFPLVSVVLISLLVKEHAANAAAPEGATAAPVAASSRESAPAKSDEEAAIPDTTSAINSSTPMSQRVVHHEIHPRYDATKHVVDGSEVLTYHNLTGQQLDHFPFHLYQNAFQPKATWVREAKQQGSRDTGYDKWEDKEYGSEDMKSIEVVGQGDLTSKLNFIQPDDGNKDDKTVVDLPLSKPIAPGAYVQFKIAFHDQMPETQARSGWKRDFVLGGQWFPKVGVWWHGAWNCHQYHATTEFFADFGVYDVKLTVPQKEVVGTSGVKVAEAENSDKTKTLTYHGDDIHDFAWTASPRFKVKEDGVYQGQMGPVQMRILMQPAHWSQVDRHEKILKGSLEQFESRYGPYPYKTITLVDPEPDSAAGGMEYPTFITGDTNWFMPEGLYLPELVVEHEFGHQYWYGMVATNEFEDAWMDEGINSYTEVKVLDAILGKKTSILNMAGATAGEREVQRMSYVGVASLDAIAQKAYEYYSFNSYAGVTYGKTASVLLTLEGIIGEDTMDKAMHAYFMKYRFTHPTKEDFLKTIEDVAGRDLHWYFNQAIYGTQILDYKVTKIETFPVNWYEEKKGEKGREHGDGASHWTKFVYEKKAKAESAEIDPDHTIQIDRNNFDNSYTQEENKKPVHKVENYWLFITQWVGQALAWWAV